MFKIRKSEYSYSYPSSIYMMHATNIVSSTFSVSAAATKTTSRTYEFEIGTVVRDSIVSASLSITGTGMYAGQVSSATTVTIEDSSQPVNVPVATFNDSEFSLTVIAGSSSSTLTLTVYHYEVIDVTQLKNGSTVVWEKAPTTPLIIDLKPILLGSASFPSDIYNKQYNVKQTFTFYTYNSHSGTSKTTTYTYYPYTEDNGVMDITIGSNFYSPAYGEYITTLLYMLSFESYKLTELSVYPSTTCSFSTGDIVRLTVTYVPYEDA